jgi:hypothetical protein
MRHPVYNPAHSLKLGDPAIDFLLLFLGELLPAARRSCPGKKAV